MKRFITKVLVSTFLVGSALPVAADSISGSVTDHYDYVVKRYPVSTEQCRVERVPVYANSQPDPSLGELVIGTAIGSAVGNVLSDRHGAGTLGGIIGANAALSKRGEQSVIGYQENERCDPVTRYESERVSQYSHSTISFWHEGRRYDLKFKK